MVAAELKICSVEGCAKKLASRGMCMMHYLRLRNAGSLSRTCSVCSVELVGPRKYCFDCQRAARNRVKREYRKRPERRAHNKKQKQEYRQRPEVRLALRTRERVKEHRRRALIRGAAADRFDPLEIFERDAWRCGLCGCSTPKGKRGTYDARAPELDHIIPIAAGGAHIRANVQCACRACNLAKGKKPLGQLRLVG